MDVVVAGGGIFGATAALELARRGHRVRLLDPGPLPYPTAASTDISKIVRMEYGADEDYTEMAERALAGWRRWNADLDDELFHETGVMFLRRTSLAPGTFEGDSLAVLRRRGHRPDRLSAADIARRFPAWKSGAYVDGMFHAAGGWVESGRAVARLLREAARAGVELQEGARIAEDHLPKADATVFALGAWTPFVLPRTAGWFRAHGMPVFHLRPADPSAFAADQFPVFGADISTTGYYGFPAHPRSGVVKIANHGAGRAIDPSSSRDVNDSETAALRAFLRETFPSLADAPVIASRICVYCDTWDGHFWISPDPARPDQIIAAGDSGHAFKFAPLLGGWIADALEGRVIPKFRWRPESRPARSDEAARNRRETGSA
jgi:glycine/D-amino acid oxidase-like deaminating enzyme